MNNLEISIVEITKSTYKAHLQGTDVQHEFNFTFDLARQQELQFLMKGISCGEADVDFAARLKKYGHDLYDLLFNEEMGKAFKKLCKESFCLHLSLPSALEILPWEYLANEEDFLFKGRNCLIRAPMEMKDIPLQAIAPPVRLLVVISNPPDLPENMKLDVVKEKRLIKDALRSLIDEGKLALNGKMRHLLKGYRMFSLISSRISFIIPVMEHLMEKKACFFLRMEKTNPCPSRAQCLQTALLEEISGLSY